jgi:hypothetical protein
MYGVNRRWVDEMTLPKNVGAISYSRNRIVKIGLMDE